MIYLPPGALRLAPDATTGTPTLYMLADDLTQKWRVTDHGNYPSRAALPLPARALRMVVMPNGDRFQIGVAGGLYSVRHIRSGVFDRHILNAYDLGRQIGVNWRSRWLMNETGPDGQPLKVEVNPTALGGTAGTDRLFPSPGVECTEWWSQTWNGPWAMTARYQQGCMEFDPRDKENAEWTDTQMVAADDLQTQVLWPGAQFEVDTALLDDGCWQVDVRFRFYGGIAPSVRQVLWDRVVSSAFLSTDFDGGCSWIDATTGAETRSGAAWAQNDRPEWNSVYQIKATGEPGRVDTTRVTDDTSQMDFPFPSGKAMVILRSGRSGVPDGVSAVGFAAQLHYAEGGGQGRANGINSIKVSPARVGELTGMPTERGFMRVTLAAEAGASYRRADEDVTRMTYWWCHGTEQEVREKLIGRLA